MNHVHGKQYRVALLDPQGQVIATGERLRLRELERTMERYQVVILPPGKSKTIVRRQSNELLPTKPSMLSIFSCSSLLVPAKKNNHSNYLKALFASMFHRVRTRCFCERSELKQFERD